MRRDIAVISICLVALILVYIVIELIIPLPTVAKKTEIQIPKGATFRQAVGIISKENLTRDENIFLFVGRLTGLHRKIRAGYYAISKVMSPLGVLCLLRNGQIIEYEVTIVEGDSLIEIAEKLAAENIMDKDRFMEISRDKDFLREYNIEAASLEGYLYPDTYKLPKGIEPEEALGIMINSMREKFSADLIKRVAELGFTEKNVLTLASIIEKEAIIEKERPLISAVYHNRLKKKMPLQADPTAIYGIKSSKERITAKDIRRKTNYNTYIIKGFPPGPIASPGIKSIIAALYPADVAYLYFVSNNDGSHHFSVTSKEHLQAVKLYRVKRNKEKEIERQKRKKQKIEKSNVSTTQSRKDAKKGGGT